jgi:predicted nucleotidyltransferase
MELKIQEILKDLEENKNIQILFAIEAGSRAWGIESEDSDYDIRFIFRHSDPKKYLSLKPLELTIDGFSEDRVYDWQGWDLTKALRHLHQMNPSICEWIYSPIVYINEPEKNFEFQTISKSLLLKQKKIIPLLYHYKSMAKSNYKAHISEKTNVKLKKYLYVIRPAGMFVWLLKSNSLDNFQINFLPILEEIKLDMSDECYANIIQIIEKKKLKKELDEEPRINSIDKWIEKVLNTEIDNTFLDSTDKSPTSNNTLDNYDQLLFKILGF